MEKLTVKASFNGGLYQTSTNFHTSRCSFAGRGSTDTELNIFEAERYFSEGRASADKGTLVDDEVLERCDFSSDARTSSVSSLDGLRRNGRSVETPTGSSEASWNSKSGFLSHGPGLFLAGRSPRSPGVRRFFRRSCPCFGKKSVDVEVRRPMELNAPLSAKRLSFRAGEVGLSSIPELAPGDEFKSELDAGEVTKISPGNWGKDRSFFNVATRFSPEKTFPTEFGHRIVSSGKLFTETAGFSFPVLSPPRESLEVFRPSEEAARTMLKPPEVALPLCERDRLRFVYPASPKARPEEDVASDTSSDLFEIETTLSVAPTTNRRLDSLDELEGRRFVGSGAAAEILQHRRSLEGVATPSVAPSECYAPSEASVVWSVATAEGFATNFSSAASNYDEFRFIEEEHDRFAEAAMAGERRKANGLLSCRCEKAVSVGPNPVRVVPPVEPDVMATNIAKLRSLGLAQERLGRPFQKN
ncbi:protein PHYTOCHROME KINASE SUBSTRATE 4-like [Curcuma longa]|uniref:protein PHYTOCHROME KINASE SUBSTRATE 4-like n=1 Tax=Curcuma longa TaxID=136217 RepID=UPI003D9DECC4